MQDRDPIRALGSCGCRALIRFIYFGPFAGRCSFRRYFACSAVSPCRWGSRSIQIGIRSGSPIAAGRSRRLLLNESGLSGFGLLRYLEGVVDFDPQVADGAL